MELVGLEENAELQVTVHGGLLVLTPVNPRITTDGKFEAALERVLKTRRRALKNPAE